MDNNASQFARLGNPWVSEKDQAEIQAQTLPEKGGKRAAKIRPNFHEIPREIPGAAERKERQEMMMWLKAHMGGSRTVAASSRFQPEKSGNFRISSSAVSELSAQDIELKLREPVHYPAPRDLVDSGHLHAKRNAYDHDMAKSLREALASVQARIDGHEGDKNYIQSLVEKYL